MEKPLRGIPAEACIEGCVELFVGLPTEPARKLIYESTKNYTGYFAESAVGEWLLICFRKTFECCFREVRYASQMPFDVFCKVVYGKYFEEVDSRSVIGAFFWKYFSGDVYERRIREAST